MKDLAPDVFRQRLLIEGRYTRSLGRGDVEAFLRDLPQALDLRIYAPPVVYSPGGQGKDINQGYDGFVALIDSGISIYVWETARFLSIVIYTCKGFDEQRAIAFTRDFFGVTELEHLAF
jgi:S-adenosylmethionine decarboxylase